MAGAARDLVHLAMLQQLADKEEEAAVFHHALTS